ncbi:MAG TPA: branched-chain amino acid ABC transporter permease [Chloroflexota bacterium]|nr:branched-chain amino acid ABC transporter permease [Chloroflexota bacterium]
MVWVNAVIQGILLGGFYALLACGLALMFGVMRIINLAHGDIAVVGAYLVWALVDRTSVSPFIAALIVLPVMLVAGYIFHLLILERSRRAGVLTPLLTTFGLAIVIQNVLLQIFSADVQSFGGNAGDITLASWQVNSQISVPALGVLILGVAVAVLGGLHLFLSRTRLGREMRATAEDADTAELVGINSRAVYARATALAVATAALAGLFLGIRTTFAPSSGPTQLIFAFESVVIGGGSLWGTLLGGVVLGVAQAVGAQVNPQYSLLAGHLVFLAVLAAPRGSLLLRRGATP